MKLNNLSYCTIQLADGSPCDNPSAQDMPFPICGRHASSLYRHVARIMGQLSDDPVFRASWFLDHVERSDQEKADAYAARDWRVYYLQVGDLIKIGYSGDLKARLNQYPPGRRLLATEPGDAGVEARRHHQFKHLLAARKEWFNPGPDLLAHIRDLNKPANRIPRRSAPTSADDHHLS